MILTLQRLRHQARLARRSARQLAKNPKYGAEFNRLVATRGRSTMSLRLPWLPFRLIDELAPMIGPGTRVFEYGGGGSTLWFLDRGATVVTAEHDASWAGRLRDEVAAPAWTLLVPDGADDLDSYVEAIQTYPDRHFDVVVVDGRERSRCIEVSASKVRPGGLMLVDDIDRVEYANAISALGWPRHDVIGFAPAKPTLAYTAILQRPPLHGG